MNLAPFPGPVSPRYDAESGIWHNGYREYLADAGRYLQSDPIGLGGGINTYAYVEGDPVNSYDPYGLQQIPSSPQAAIAQAIAQQRTAQARFYAAPDFVNINVSWHRFSATISRTKYGKNFISAGVTLAPPSSKNPFTRASASVNVGYVCPKGSNDLTTQDQINDALSGGGFSASGYYYGVGGGMSWGQTANTVFFGLGVGGGSGGTEVGYEF